MRVGDGLLDVVLLVQAVFVVSYHLQVIVVGNVVFVPLTLLDRAVLDIALARVVRLLVLFLTWQVLLSDRLHLSFDYLLEQIVRRRNGVLLEEVDRVHAVLDHLEEHHADHFLHGLAIEVVDEDALHVAASNCSHLAPE